MGSGQAIHVKDLTIGGFALMIIRAIPTGPASFRVQNRRISRETELRLRWSGWRRWKRRHWSRRHAGLGYAFMRATAGQENDPAQEQRRYLERCWSMYSASFESFSAATRRALVD